MTLFITTFVMVFLLGFQQKNVMHNHYYLAAITSFCIGTAQYFLTHGIIDMGYEAIIYMGLGGSFGITLSMFLHNMMRSKYEKRTNN